jgi:hypothetical protein
MKHYLTVDRYLGRRRLVGHLPSVYDAYEWDLHPNVSVENERGTLVLYVYMSTGLGWCYHVLVGKAGYPVGGFVTIDAALLAGMDALRKVRNYDTAPIVKDSAR